MTGRTTPRTLVQALLTDGPLKAKPVEVEPVEGRPPKTIDLPLRRLVITATRLASQCAGRVFSSL